jgi:hypothetical protein
VIFGWQEAYHGDSEGSSVRRTVGVSPTLDSWGDDAVGDCVGGTIEVAGAEGADVGDDDVGAGLARVNVDRERRRPNWVHVHSGGGGC